MNSKPEPLNAFDAGQLHVSVYSSREDMGDAAASETARWLAETIESKGKARVVFACAPSQDEFLSALTDPGKCGNIEWASVTAFHMDDYVGLTAEQPQSFRHYLHQHLLSKVGVGKFNPIQAEAESPDAECARYTALLQEEPIDLICLGIGENGHIAFNDPPVADFNDPALIKIVELDEVCRQQQVNDGCFPDFDSVPTHAFSLTLTVFRNARKLCCIVPGPRKAQAVHDALRGPVSTACPASILREHPDAQLFIDKDAASLLL